MVSSKRACTNKVANKCIWIYFPHPVANFPFQAPAAKRLCQRQRSDSEETVAAISDPLALLNRSCEQIEDGGEAEGPAENGFKEHNGTESRLHSPTLSFSSETRDLNGKKVSSYE